jgi:hypothetical protein
MCTLQAVIFAIRGEGVLRDLFSQLKFSSLSCEITEKSNGEERPEVGECKERKPS